MNSETFENNCSLDSIKEIGTINLKTNISSSFFNNMKTTGNNRNDYVYHSKKNQNGNQTQHKYFFFVENESKNSISKKDNGIQNQHSQPNILVKEKNETNKKTSFDSTKKSTIKKNINISREQNNNTTKNFPNDKIIKNIDNILSEVKKFKTELCHSWELTGACKYGRNVNINI